MQSFFRKLNMFNTKLAKRRSHLSLKTHHEKEESKKQHSEMLN